MKKKAEFIIAALTLMFLCFSIGYFVGRRSAPTSVSVSSGTVLTEVGEEEPSTNVASAFFDEPSPPLAAASPDPTPPPDPTVDTPPSPSPSPETEPAAESPETEPPEASPGTAAQVDAESHYDEQGRLRINLATQAELETLPGIGPTLASRIIEFRDANGGFNRLTTLKSISGIGDKRYDAIKDLITVE